MKKPYRYRTAAESMKPGYLAKRFRALRRLQRMKMRAESPVAQLKAKKAA